MIVNFSCRSQITVSQGSLQKITNRQASLEMIESEFTKSWPDQDVVASPSYGSESADSTALHSRYKWPKPPPKAVKSNLTSFSNFSNLPIEIRQIIWRLTLHPRTIEVEFHPSRGFYARVKTPVTLRVCTDSRKAVIHLYSLCFGSLLYSPNIVFNFKLDTLFFMYTMQPRIAQFLVGLTEHETKHIESIAVDQLINEDMESEFVSEDNSLELFRLAIRRMPAMRQFMIVYILDDILHDHGFPESTCPVELFHEFTYEWHQWMHDRGFYWEDVFGLCEFSKLPDSSQETRGFEVPKTGSLWGWRPTDLVMNTPPFCGRL